jgi:putative ABC transport system permease protein
MKNIDIIKRASSSLRNAKVRTALTSLAIAVGAFTLTISLAAGEGARQYTSKLINSNIDPQILAIAKNKSFFESGTPGTSSTPLEYTDGTDTITRPAGGQIIEALNQEDIDKIAARDDIAVISPAYTINAKYIKSYDSKKYTLSVTQYNRGVVQNVLAGTLPALHQPIGKNEIVLPDTYVKLLGYSQPSDIIGKKVTIHLERTPQYTAAEVQAAAAQGLAGLRNLALVEAKDYDFTVVAVTGKNITAITSTSTIQIGNDEAKAMSEYSTTGTSSFQKYIIATASVKEGVDPEKVKNSLIEEGYGVQTAKDLQSLLFTIVNTLQGVVFGFGIVALIASVFGIINTQYISVLERTREIGLMKALGMRGRHVSRLFQFEAAWIGLLGGLIGSSVAIIAGNSLNPTITEQLGLGEGNYILIFVPIQVIVLVISLTIVAMLAGFFPARKAAKLDPIEALRVE